MPDRFHLKDPRLKTVAEKILAGERLDRTDGLVAAETRDLLGLGALANFRREELHGARTFFNINRQY